MKNEKMVIEVNEKDEGFMRAYEQFKRPPYDLEGSKNGGQEFRVENAGHDICLQESQGRRNRRT